MEKTKTTTGTTSNAQAVAGQYRQLTVLWIVALLLVGAQFFVAYRWFRPSLLLADGRPSTLLIVLGVVAIAEFVLSIWLWRGVQLDAEKKTDPWLSQLGYIAAWLLCLSAGLLGFAIAFSADGRYYYAFYIVAALGVLYHQPARETLTAAAPKSEPTKKVAKWAAGATAAPAAELTPADEPVPPAEEPAVTVASDPIYESEDQVYEGDSDVTPNRTATDS